jgi:molecular chaperone DnaK (HSP70)
LQPPSALGYLCRVDISATIMIGIDLGTTKSWVAVYQNGQTKLIPNALGHLMTPAARERRH